MINKKYLIGFVLIVLIFAGLITYFYVKKTMKNEETSERYCIKDEDCSCGVHITTRNCFYGNKRYVDPSQQCPDFCTGIAGHLTIKCIKNECKQVQNK